MKPVILILFLFAVSLLPASSRAAILVENDVQAAADGDEEPVSYTPPRVRKVAYEPFFRHQVRVGLQLGSNVSEGKYHRMERRFMSDFNLDYSWFCGIDVSAAFSFTYLYALNRHLSVGATLGRAADATSFSGSTPFLFGLEHFILPNGDYRSGDMTTHSGFFMPTVQYNWCRAGVCTFYSRLAAGAQRQRITISYSDGSSRLRVYDRRLFLPAYQISFAGVEMGNNRLSAYAELGYGMEGVLHVGLAYRFLRAGK